MYLKVAIPAAPERSDEGGKEDSADAAGGEEAKAFEMPKEAPPDGLEDLVGFQSCEPRTSRFTDDYEVGPKLGEGGFSTVHRVEDKVTGKPAAAKIIYKSRLTENERKGLRAEVDVMAALDHPNIVKLLAFYEEDGKYVIVTELMEGGELFEQIVQRVSACGSLTLRLPHWHRSFPPPSAVLFLPPPFPLLWDQRRFIRRGKRGTLCERCWRPWHICMDETLCTATSRCAAFPSLAFPSYNYPLCSLKTFSLAALGRELT